MLRHVALVTSDVSEERISSIIRMARLGELGTTLAVTDSCHPDDGSARLFQNVGTYKSQTAFFCCSVVMEMPLNTHLITTRLCYILAHVEVALSASLALCQTYSVPFRRQANYTDRQPPLIRKFSHLFRVEGVVWSAQRFPRQSISVL
jgi:hypothetical protein